MCQSCRLGAITEDVELYGNSQKNTYTYTYDVCGQPLNYMGATCKWDVYGNLVSYSKGNDKITYTYTSDGRRRTKTVNGVTTTYRYHNGLLLSETTGDETLRYYYDNTGEVLSIGYIKGSKAENKYFFTRNAQNDIVSVYRSSDSKLIGTYEYDLWGKPISIKEATPGIDTDGILTKNPLRYRGYRYDAETGFYHLKSRYYDPNIRRFISADTVAVLTVETTSPGFKNLFAYCENNPIIMEDSTGQAGIVIFGVYIGAELLFDFFGLAVSFIDLAHNLKDPLAYVGVFCDAVDVLFPGSCSGEVVSVVKYSVRYGPDFVMAFISKFGDDAAALAVKHGDEVIEGLAQYGDDFGKMGTYVENPNIKVDWTQYAEHAAERMQQRGMTQEMVNNIVENGKVLSQNNGNKFAYITQEGVAIVSKEGKLITAWSSADFDSSMLEIISKLFGE